MFVLYMIRTVLQEIILAAVWTQGDCTRGRESRSYLFYSASKKYKENARVNEDLS